MPPRILVDPNALICPDYALDIYAGARKLIAPGAEVAEVAQRLANIWTAGNNVDRGLCNHQVEADAIAAADAEALLQAQAEQQRLEAEQQAEEEHRESEKKKPKAPDFDEEASIPNHPVLRPHPFAVNKLRLFEYVELWYFTRDGCLDATNHLRTINDDAFGLIRSEDGLALRSLAATRPSKKAIPDDNLSWYQMSTAKSTYIAEIERLNWPLKHRQAIQEFFYALDMHPYRNAHEYGDTILLRYQASSRRLWHEQLKIPGGSFNLRHINETLLDRIATTYLNELKFASTQRSVLNLL
ncbi:hypothetical protein HETIRDRAFT_309375, partial [Heterobasidion irregulare TC 32-1]